MTKEPREDLVQTQFSELAEKYPDLSLSEFKENKGWIITGALAFCAEFEGEKICDEFQVELTIPQDYPVLLPSVKETGGLIPSDFHTNPDGTLCLETPEEIRLKFLEQPTLLGFVENIILHYLYSFCYFKKFGEMPYGERSHGVKGRIEFYYDYFETQDLEVVIGLLRILADDSYMDNNYCPCGSGLKEKKCHGQKLLNLKNLLPQTDYIKIYDKIFNYYYEATKAFPKMVCVRKERMKEIKKLKRRRNVRKA